MAIGSKKGAKDVVLPHSQAKLDLYKNYLEHYLRVLSLTPYVDGINLFDVFCGSGEYTDGKFGSPIITNQTIKKINDELNKMGKKAKSVQLHINDLDSIKIENVKRILTSQKNPNCQYFAYNTDANSFLENVIQVINGLDNKKRNLIFIDPYGYSLIDKDKIHNLIKNEYTEILLFLPTMQMYRFKSIALNDFERSCYDGLRNFIFSFFPENHKIHHDGIQDIFEFINEIKEALNFNKQFYTCSHYIERGKGNYYSLFFITSNIYGLEKMVESKWKLDPNKGKGFNQPSVQGNMFDSSFLEADISHNIANLKNIFVEFLQKNGTLNNCQIYELALAAEYTPAQAKKAIDELLSNRRIKDITGESNPLGAYINYNNYKDRIIKVTFGLRK